MTPTLYIVRTPDGLDFPLPSYTSRYHMALNLQAGIASSIKLSPGERVYVPVGFAIGIPDGFCGQIVSIPSLAKEAGIIVLDAPSLIHPNDRNPISVLLENTSPHQYILNRGTVIAQLLITPAIQIRWEVKTSKLETSTKTSPKEIEIDRGAD